MELYQANRQWATRPADERFATLESMYAACHAYFQSSKQSKFTFKGVDFEPQGNEVMLHGLSSGTHTRLTHYAFGQLATDLASPANYLRTLPPQLACDNLNYGLTVADKDKLNVGLFHSNNGNGLICRCVTSSVYQRIWNYEIIDRLIPLANDGWTVPPAMDNADRPSGLYASDHDMFTFLVDEQHRINDNSEGGLARGFFVINSEVGQSAFKVLTFLYRYVCGNHIVWGAKNVQQVRIIHKGNPARNWDNTLRIELTKYANESASNDTFKIERAMRFDLGATKEKVLDALFSKRSLGITKKNLESAYSIAETRHELEPSYESPPNTVWGMVNGLTRVSQQSTYGDERTKLDVAAGKIMEMAF